MNRHQRAAAIARDRTLVTADPATVSWLTGLAPEIEWGPSPFSAPPIAILEPDGRVRAVVSEDEAGGLAPRRRAADLPRLRARGRRPARGGARGR